jgi:hypothetical protein
VIGTRRWPVVLAAALALAGRAPAQEREPSKPGTSTLIVGIDVSGSFRNAGLYDDAVDFVALYIHAHLNGLGGLRRPSALFVSSIGGVRPSEAKAFHPINDFEGRTPEQIAADIREWFPKTPDPYTDYNPFFQRVTSLVKERGLILAPLNVVLLSDGVQDAPQTRTAANQNPYARIDLSPLEFLSRSVTVRLLYASPAVGENWKRDVQRKRVRLWTQEAQVMEGWRKQYRQGVPLARQHDLWRWVHDNVDFRARAGKMF